MKKTKTIFVFYRQDVAYSATGDSVGGRLASGASPGRARSRQLLVGNQSATSENYCGTSPAHWAHDKETGTSATQSSPNYDYYHNDHDH